MIAGTLPATSGYGRSVPPTEPGRQPMPAPATPLDDPQIPPLLSVTAAAERLGCSKQWVSRLVQTGRLTGVPVGNTTILAEAQVAALAAARRQGQTDWQAPAPRRPLPALVSTTEAAQILGFAQENRPRELYYEGVIPGRQVGRNIVFRRDTITSVALLRQLRGRASGKPDPPAVSPPHAG